MHSDIIPQEERRKRQRYAGSERTGRKSTVGKETQDGEVTMQKKMTAKDADGLSLSYSWKKRNFNNIPSKKFGSETFYLLRIHDQMQDLKDDARNMKEIGWKVRTTKGGYYWYLWVGGSPLKSYLR